MLMKYQKRRKIAASERDELWRQSQDVKLVRDELGVGEEVLGEALEGVAQVEDDVADVLALGARALDHERAF
jgi:hypothetical protein